MKLKQRLSDVLYKIRNPKYDERERDFKRELNAKRILLIFPFIIAAIILLLLSLGK